MRRWWLLASGLLALLAGGGCTQREEVTLGSAGVASGRAASPEAREAAKLISRSVWGVLPQAPRYKKDARPEMIRGSAVAVAEDRLLATCRVVGGRKQVGLVRHNKYELAKVGRRLAGNVCELRVAGVELTPVVGSRSLGEMGEGEPLYALVNRDSARFALTEGRLTGGKGSGRQATSLELPSGPLSVVLFDGDGRLVGLAVPGRVRRVVPEGALSGTVGF